MGCSLDNPQTPKEVSTPSLENSPSPTDVGKVTLLPSFPSKKAQSLELEE